MKRHLKRFAVPRSWLISRRDNVFITRPFPGGHAFDLGLPLGVVIRDFLGFARTLKEANHILHDKLVLVDGRRRRDRRFFVGLFDVLSFPDLGSYFRVVLDSLGRLKLLPVEEKESLFKVCKVIGKTLVRGGKVQLNFHDGRNVLVDDGKKFPIGCSVVVSLPDNKLGDVLEFKEGALVYLVRGKHAGDVGVLKKIVGGKILYHKGDDVVETLKDYAFVVGGKEPVLSLDVENE